MSAVSWWSILADISWGNGDDVAAGLSSSSKPAWWCYRVPQSCKRAKPQMYKYFWSLCVIFAIILFIKASHMTKPSVSVGRAWVRVQMEEGNCGIYLINLLDNMRYRELQREAKEFLMGICCPRP